MMGRVRISWYTSESATESIRLDGTEIHTDEFATKKNHEHITAILSDGDYNLVITSADASGNSNSSTIEFTVDVGATADNGNSGNTNSGGNSASDSDDEGEASSEISTTTMQIAVLAIVFLLIVAFIRVSRNDNEENDKWSIIDSGNETRTQCVLQTVIYHQSRWQVSCQIKTNENP